jgi:hypothetical protein
MRKNSIILILNIIFCSDVFGQFDQQVFFNRANTIYHNLSTSDINNFSVLITSDYFEYKTGKILNHDEYAPIEFIWIKPRQLHFNRKEFPSNTDSIQQTIILQLQNEMFQELRGIFIDWQRFFGENLLYDLPAKYKIDSIDDTVHISFDSYENNEPVKLKFYFGLNALCFRIETIYQNINQKIITFPSYIYVDNKWLCSEWIVKIIQNGIINSGFSVKLKSRKYKESWLPLQALIQVQTVQKLNQTFTRLYKFKKLGVNQELKSLQN